MDEYLMICFVVAIVYGICFGIVTDLVIKNKGYKEEWFLWGFLFGVFALVVACTKPINAQVASNRTPSAMNDSAPHTTGNKEDYDILYNIPENIYSDGSPVLICEGILLKEKATEKIFARCKFQVISQKKIKAAFVSIIEYDVAGDFLGETNIQYLDLDRISGSCFGDLKLVAMSNMITRKIKVVCTKIIYADDTKWEFTKEWEVLPEQCLLNTALDFALIEQYRQEINSEANYIPNQTEYYWNCTCGCINDSANTTCIKCGATKYSVFDAYSPEILLKKYEEKTNREREEAQRIAQKAKKRNKLICICGFTVVAFVVIILLGVHVIVPSVKYYQADKLVAAGLYGEAIEAYEAMEESEKKNERIASAYYTYGEALLAEMKYEDAANQFMCAGNYKDSKERVKATYYAFGESLFAEHNFQRAIKYFKKAKDYRDATEQINATFYAHAESLLAEGNYEQAVVQFKNAGEYEDAKDRVSATYYEYAEALLADYNYEEAIIQFNNAGDYKDAEKRKCEVHDIECYEKAEKSLLLGEKIDAYKQFKKVEDYIDASQRAEEIKIELKSDISLELLAFNIEENDKTTILKKIPKQANYLHFIFEVQEINLPVENIDLAYQIQWPEQEMTTGDGKISGMAQGGTCQIYWGQGYAHTIDGELVVNILIADTDIILDTFTIRLGE